MNFFRRSPPTVTDKDDDASSHEESHDESSHGSEGTDDDHDDDEEEEGGTHKDDAAIAQPALDDYLQRPKEVIRQDSLEVVCADNEAIATAPDAQDDLTSPPALAAAVKPEDARHVTDEAEDHSQHDDHHHDEESSGSETDDESSVESEKKGWFSFLRRKKHHESSEEESESSEDESEDDENVQEQPVAAQAESTHYTEQQASTEETAGEEEIAQAIQRVQQRISEYRRKQEAKSSGVVTDDLQETSVEKPDDNKTAEGTVEAAAKNNDESKISQYVSSEAELAGERGHEKEALIESSAETLLTQESSIDNGMRTEMTNAEREKNQFKGGPDEDEQRNNYDTEEEEDHDDDAPTLQERHSLLSLAAEHNRVDVIKELVSMTTSDLDRTSLLQGVGGHTERDDNEPNDDVFVPPPLHAAVAHGSIDAASCLLRMGADPSLRPLLPAIGGATAGLHRSNSNAEQDRNYKKYHGRSAWELAFGALIEVEDGCDEEKQEVENTTSRGWFRFGTKEEEIKSELCTKENGVRYKRISGLNIPPTKLDGIRHAFTAEALRAIGSDEVHRLSQLMEAGMTVDIEVAGKTLKKWAGEMDAVRCLALMMRGGIEEVEDGEGEMSKDGKEELAGKEGGVEPLAEVTLDGRLSGLSHSDIATLIQENESLIPALTSCRDDLVEEMDMYQNMLRDIKSSGGRGVLSSRSLLELVRSLKDERQESEETFKQWQEAWEEREDELDFFWEEAMEEDMREEFAQSGVLDGVTEPTPVGVKPISSDLTYQELAHRYYEADSRVSTLRSSIASLAKESGRYRDEIEKSGMSGALSLVKSLRSEVKELKEKISQAQAGESTCRRKIELIQSYIGRPVNGDVEELEGFQLKSIVDMQVGRDRGQSPLLEQPPLESDLCRVPTSEVFSSQPHIFRQGAIGHDVEGGELYADADQIESDESDEGIQKDQESIDAANVSGTDSCNYESADNDQSTYQANQKVSGSVTDDVQGEECANATPISVEHEDAMIGGPASQPVAISRNDEAGVEQAPKHGHEYKDITAESKPQNVPMRASVMLESGMSTAIILRQPNGKSNSLSFQIWDLLRRIVGLGRTSSSASSSYREYDVTNSSHIMIV